jgi:hypothetical protein
MFEQMRNTFSAGDVKYWIQKYKKDWRKTNAELTTYLGSVIRLPEEVRDLRATLFWVSPVRRARMQELFQQKIKIGWSILCLSGYLIWLARPELVYMGVVYTRNFQFSYWRRDTKGPIHLTNLDFYPEERFQLDV